MASHWSNFIFLKYYNYLYVDSSCFSINNSSLLRTQTKIKCSFFLFCFFNVKLHTISCRHRLLQNVRSYCSRSGENSLGKIWDIFGLFSLTIIPRLFKPIPRFMYMTRICTHIKERIRMWLNKCTWLTYGDHLYRIQIQEEFSTEFFYSVIKFSLN